VKSVKAQSAKNYSQFHSSKLVRCDGASRCHPEPRKTAKDPASGETLPFLGACLST
jgi:hypothetical protein